MIGADVDRNEGGCSKQDGPQPDGEIGGIKIRAARGAIALNPNGTAGEDISNEVADGKVLVEREVGTAKGPAAGDFALETAALVNQRAEEFCCPFSFGINVLRSQRIWAAEPGFRNVGHGGRLLPIDGARTGKQELASVAGGGELQNTLGSRDDGGEHLEGGIHCCSGIAVSGCVNDVTEFTSGKREGADISFMQGDSRIAGQMRTFRSERARIAGEHGDGGIQAELAIDVAEALNEPAAEKTGSACEKDALTSDFCPKRSGSIEDLEQIFGGQRSSRIHQSSSGGMIISEAKTSRGRRGAMSSMGRLTMVPSGRADDVARGAKSDWTIRGRRKRRVRDVENGLNLLAKVCVIKNFAALDAISLGDSADIGQGQMTGWIAADHPAFEVIALGGHDGGVGAVAEDEVLDG